MRSEINSIKKSHESQNSIDRSHEYWPLLKHIMSKVMTVTVPMIAMNTTKKLFPAQDVGCDSKTQSSSILGLAYETVTEMSNTSTLETRPTLVISLYGLEVLLVD